MRIEHTPAMTPTIDPTPKQTTAEHIKAIEPAAAAIPSTAVVISGQTLLRQRLFFSAPDVEPPMPDIKLDHMVLRPVLYLSKDDRVLLGDIYEFAQLEGIDLEYVDRLGFNLAEYRGSDDGRRMNPHNRGDFFDLEGHMLSYSFTDEDTVAAKKVRESPALQTTRLDRGFIAYDTDKDYSSMFHSHFGFLELVVNRFSASSDLMPVDGRFTRHQYTKHDYIEHVSKEVYEHKVFRNRYKQTEGGKEGARPVAPDTPSGAQPSTLREIIHQYLQKNAIPTLFEAIARLRR